MYRDLFYDKAATRVAEGGMAAYDIGKERHTSMHKEMWQELESHLFVIFFFQSFAYS